MREGDGGVWCPSGRLLEIMSRELQVGIATLGRNTAIKNREKLAKNLGKAQKIEIQQGSHADSLSRWYLCGGRDRESPGLRDLTKEMAQGYQPQGAWTHEKKRALWISKHLLVRKRGERWRGFDAYEYQHMSCHPCAHSLGLEVTQDAPWSRSAATAGQSTLLSSPKGQRQKERRGDSFPAHGAALSQLLALIHKN